jgi:hypothetical protein
MPRKQPTPTELATRRTNGRYAWGTEAIAKEIGRSPNATYHMLHRGLIRSAHKVGNLWVAEREALHAEMRGSVVS